MDRLRILWIFPHRTARFEEVGALLRAGAEVIPTSGESRDFPNPVQESGDADPYAPAWSSTCTVPPDVLRLLRPHDRYARPHRLADDLIDALNAWIDVVWVGTSTPLVVALLRRFKGVVVLRAYGGYPYSRSLGRWPLRNGPLNLIGCSDRYVFCPALPYQSLVEDPRLTRNEVFLPACVTASRLRGRWAGAASDPVACEVISLIERYRTQEYEQFVGTYGDVPLRVFGQNPRGGRAGTDERIVGTLDDDAYYAGIASCRVMIYVGLGSRYHLHYHPLEALMMGVPVIFASSSALAHTALYMGVSRDTLRDAGMCETPTDARALAIELIRNAELAVSVSKRQDVLRDIYRPESWDPVVSTLVQRLHSSASFVRTRRESDEDARPFGSPLDGSVVRGVTRTIRRGVSARWRRALARVGRR